MDVVLFAIRQKFCKSASFSSRFWYFFGGFFALRLEFHDARQINIGNRIVSLMDVPVNGSRGSAQIICLHDVIYMLSSLYSA